MHGEPCRCWPDDGADFELLGQETAYVITQ